MIEISGFQLSITEISLTIGLLFFAIISLVTIRRISRLQSRLDSIALAMSREINMVNQGAIGIGRRFSSIEKNLKKSAKIASFEAAKELQSAPGSFSEAQIKARKSVQEEKLTKTAPKSGLSTRAEQALSAWINNQKSA